jgi:hypothetical protein
MEFVHRCHFCGWQREAESPTILEPHCETCGCLLSSGRPDQFAPHGTTVERRFGRGLSLPPRLARALRLSAFASVLLAAAATGFHVGGAWIAIAAIGAGGLAATPALAR